MAAEAGQHTGKVREAALEPVTYAGAVASCFLRRLRCLPLRPGFLLGFWWALRRAVGVTTHRQPETDTRTDGDSGTDTQGQHDRLSARWLRQGWEPPGATV